jgi:MFS family permease
LAMSAMVALRTDFVHPKNRGKINGFINFIGYIVMGFGMLLGNYLYVNFIPQLPFYLTLGLIVPELLIILFLVHEPKRRMGGQTASNGGGESPQRP